MSDAETGITVPAPYDARPSGSGVVTYQAVLLGLEVVPKTDGVRSLVVTRGHEIVARFDLSVEVAAHIAQLLTAPQQPEAA